MYTREQCVCVLSEVRHEHGGDGVVQVALEVGDECVPRGQVRAQVASALPPRQLQRVHVH